MATETTLPAPDRFDPWVKLVTLWHQGQVRKVDGQPYVNHLLRVHQLVLDYGRAVQMPEHELDLAAKVAICHDLLEDTEIPHEAVFDRIGALGYFHVLEVTDLDEIAPEVNLLSRFQRKSLGPLRLWTMSPTARLVKMADLVDNLRSEVDDNPFWSLYLREKAAMIAMARTLHHTDKVIVPLLREAIEAFDHLTRRVEDAQRKKS